MFTKILVATDLSEASERMICALRGLKMLGTTEILLVHCLNIRDVGSIAPEVMDWQSLPWRNTKSCWRTRILK
jgi:hypothetical protein